jgi:hypothetical protein
MLGGNPELARELFQKFIQKSPAHLLARVSYLQFSVIPRLDEDEFVKVGRELDAAIALAKAEPGNEDLNLLNAIGQERWLLLKKYQKKIF